MGLAFHLVCLCFVTSESDRLTRSLGVAPHFLWADSLNHGLNGMRMLPCKYRESVRVIILKGLPLDQLQEQFKDATSDELHTMRAHIGLGKAGTK